MNNKRTKTISHKIRYEPIDVVSSPLRKNYREGAHSIQDRYLNEQSSRLKTTVLVNEEDVWSQKDLKQEIIRKQLSLLPKIDAKYSLKNNQKESFFCRPLLTRKHYSYAKRQINQETNFQNYEIKQKNNYVFVTHEGNRIKNQDRVVIQEFEISQKKYSCYAVFDGHGGHLASTYLASHLINFVKNQLTLGNLPQTALKLSLSQIQQRFKKNPRLSHKSGACALVCLLSGIQCWTANVGDSRLLSIDNKNQIVQITRDHKPQDQIQRKRIQYYGGQVYRNSSIHDQDQILKPPFRVYPGKLSVSRTIGDISIKKNNPNLVIADPDVFHFNISNLSVLLLITDGVYEKFTNKQISQFFVGGIRLIEGVGRLFEQAYNRHSQDNRSLIAVRLN